MNKTMIALMIVSLATLMPVPTQAGDITQGCVLDSLGLGPSIDGDDVCFYECPNGSQGVDVLGRPLCIKDLPGLENAGLCKADGTVGVYYGDKSLCFDTLGGEDPCVTVPAACKGLPGLGKPPCPRSEDDGGFGGTHVTCYYRCMPADELHISVTAEDTDADVDGYTDCGDARAECPRLRVHCEAVSGELAQFADERGCVGDSYETWSSRVTVTCTAVGTGFLCSIIDCDVSANASVQRACIESNPNTPAEIVVELLSNVPAGPVQALAIAQFQGIGETFTGWGLVYDGHDGERNCWAGPL